MTVFNNPNADRIVLVDLHPYDVEDEVVVDKYVASEFYITEPTDTPANTIYTGSVQGEVSFRRELFNQEKIGGQSIPDRGALSIINSLEPDADESRYDEWLDPSKYTWDGRDIEIYVMLRGDDYSSKEKILDGVIDDIDYTENTITFRVRSKQILLDKLIQTTRYTGAGGIEGGSELTGLPKPYVVGEVFNIAPVMINSAYLVYQINDNTAVNAISSVRDNGVALTLDTGIGTSGDFADYTALTGATIGAGKYATCLAQGLIRLNSSPVGAVTCDAQGDDLGGTYSGTVADIADYIVGTREGLSVNSASISALNTANSSVVGFYTGSDEYTILEVLDVLFNSVGAWYGFNRVGEFDCGQFTAPSTSEDLALGMMDIQNETLERVSAGAVVHTMSLKYKKNWTPQDVDALAGSVSEANRSIFSREYSITAPETASGVATKFLNSKPIVFDTVLHVEANANTERSRQLALLDERRNIFRFTTNLKPLQVGLNDVIKLTHDRFGLSSGDYFSVIGIEEEYLAERVSLIVWG